MTAGVTPMMAQYLEIKANYADALLFYRMGDFYEMFFDDAEAAAAALDIALTKRGKHLGQDIPMCGVPVHSAEGYLLSLIRKGFRVAVCEQLEDPAEAKKRGSKAVVKRDVVRLVTPGTLSEDALLEARTNNFLAAFAEVRGAGALAWVDMSTGALFVCACPRVRLGPEMARLSPNEVILPPKLMPELAGIVSEFGASPTELGSASFDSTAGKDRVAKAFEVDTPDAFGTFNRAEISALAALIDYLDLTQRGQMPYLRRPVRERPETTMQIDAATRRNLELTEALSGGRAGSLLATIDKTSSAAGARLLARRLSSPSCDRSEIAARLDQIDALLDRPDTLELLQEKLRSTPDLERSISRLSLDRGGPRDLAAVREALAVATNTNAALADLPAFEKDRTALVDPGKLLPELKRALTDDLPLSIRDGGFIASSFDKDLAELRALRDDGRSAVAGLQADYSRLAEISSLKIRHNNVLGYFIETPATHAKKMLAEPLSDTFRHRQTTANAVRFTTIELSELETRILNAGAQVVEIEKRHYFALKEQVLAFVDELHDLSSALAAIDVAISGARMATDARWCRPVLTDGREFEVVAGRHPVVEHALGRTGDPFIANDCQLGEHPIWLLTGPNMAGKSTFLRQNALIALLAQMGSYVPADSAIIGLVSQLFSRVGASDDLARGRSTFMVEMVETAAILNQADDRALVILDEIGRGTATYDGLSIAWATLEHLHDQNRARALFATHYHELTALAGRLEGVENATVEVREWEGEIVFLHEVRRGAADRSYGVQVARLAGLPDAVINRARDVLDRLEQGEREGGATAETLLDDLPLFTAQPTRPKPAVQSAAEDRLNTIAPDELTPKEALDLIYELKELVRKT